MFVYTSLIASVLFFAESVQSHGYLKSPRSRNFVAFEDGVWWSQSESDLPKESCPHCLNRGGTAASCGIVDGRNYDYPKNINGNPLPWSSQASFKEEEIIDVEVVLSAHHKGHFEFKACPLSESQVPDKNCFDSHPLEFISDELYGAPKDFQHPDRAYIAPTSMGIYDSSGVYGMLFHYKLKLPNGLSGKVLLQWHYYTANSCVYDGYDSYSFPDSSWTNPSLGVCTNIPEDGNGVPEQFWNCAEILIEGTPNPTTSMSPTPPTTPAPTKTPTSQPEPSPTNVPAPTPPVTEEDSRLIAYLGNWQSCPTTEEVAKYTHIVIAFAVSYTWSPSKNICSSTCEITVPPICNNSPNPGLVSEWQAAGKKVILSFGGAGMGGSWDGDVNDCWEYCYGRETQVVDQLVGIVDNMGLDGVDIDFEYHVTPEAVGFLNQVTSGLRNALPEGSEIAHAPMDSDIIPGKPYYDNVLAVTGHYIDFLMPQYYNGYTRPAIDGIAGTGAGSISALSHYNNIVNGIYGGDPKRVVFGFCISDCGGTGSNANAQQASTVMNELATVYPCNGGAFFWVAEHDTGGSWSSAVGATIFASAEKHCLSSPTQTPRTTPSPTKVPTASPVISPTKSPVKATKSPTEAPVKATKSPTKSPIKATKSPTEAPVASPPTISGGNPCCPVGYTGLRAWNDCHSYYHCVEGIVTGDLIDVPAGTLFDQTIQNFNWASQVMCVVDSCGGAPNLAPTKSPTEAPVASPPTISGGNPCCPAGYTGLRAWNDCHSYYHCVEGIVTGDLIDVPAGTLFDQTIQNFNWASQVMCVVDSCTRRLRGSNNSSRKFDWMNEK